MVQRITLLVLLLAISGRAATFTVAMTSFLKFQPAEVEVAVGDTVVWTNEDTTNPHDTVSTEGFWSSPLLDYGQTYSLTFPITGSFPYVDSFYAEAGMTGTVVVVSAVAEPVLEEPIPVAGEGLQLTVSNLVAGETNILQISKDLTDWTAIYTNVAVGANYTYLDVAAVTNRLRFYRVLVPP